MSRKFLCFVVPVCISNFVVPLLLVSQLVVAELVVKLVSVVLPVLENMCLDMMLLVAVENMVVAMVVQIVVEWYQWRLTDRCRFWSSSSVYSSSIVYSKLYFIWFNPICFCNYVQSCSTFASLQSNQTTFCLSKTFFVLKL